MSKIQMLQCKHGERNKPPDSKGVCAIDFKTFANFLSKKYCNSRWLWRYRIKVMIKNFLTQNEVARQANADWHEITRLVATGILKPVARVNGSRLVFSPGDVRIVKRAIQSTPAVVEVAL
jgi:hypothetical protein